MYKKVFNFILVSLVILFTPAIYAGVSEWIPMDISKGLIIIDVEINGKPARAKLDTGAEGNSISMSFLDQNKISYRKGERVMIEAEYANDYTNRVDGLNIKFLGQDIPFGNLLPFENDDDYDVVLGMPIFHGFVFQIDYPESRLRLATRDAINLKGVANVPLSSGRKKMRLVANLKLNGSDVELLLDTGNSGSILLHRSFAERRGWVEEFKVGQEKKPGAVNQEIEAELLRLPESQFGPYTLEDVLVSIPEKGQSKGLRKRRYGRLNYQGVNYRGNLGYDMLKHFVVTLDARYALLHIQAQ